MNNPDPTPKPVSKKPVLTHPKKPGDPQKSSTPDFDQSVEAGGVD